MSTRARWFDHIGFDDAYVRVTDHTGLDATTALTYMAWVVWDSSADTNLRHVLSKWNAYVMRVSSSNGVSQTVFISGEKTLNSSLGPVSGKAYHVAATYDGANQKLYFYREDTDTLTTYTRAQTGSIASTANNFYIGNYEGLSASFKHKGIIWDVRVYKNVALSEAQIADMRYADMGDTTHGTPELSMALGEASPETDAFGGASGTVNRGVYCLRSREQSEYVNHTRNIGLITETGAETTLKTKLEELGHTVTTINDGSAAAHNYSGYDLVIVGYLDSTVINAAVDAVLASGKPAIFGGPKGNSTTQNNHTDVPGVRARIISAVDTSQVTRTLITPQSVAGHSMISAPVITGSNWLSRAGSTVKSIPPASASWVGDVIANDQATGRPAIIALEEGDNNLDAAPTAARYVWMGHLRENQSIREYDGLFWLQRAIEWVAVAPGAPVIGVVADSPTQATVTVITPGEFATDHELYVALSPTNLYVAGNLYAGSLGATPTSVVVTGRTELLTYYFGLRAIVGAGNTDSGIVSVTMPEQLDPTLALIGRTDTSATLRLINVADEDADEVNFQSTTDADTGYATPFDDVTLTDASRFTHQVTGRTASTSYRSRVRYRVGAGAWSAWLELEWTTLATPVPADILSHWLAPTYGEMVTGTYCAQMAIEIPFVITDIEISDDNGASWTPLAGWSEYAAADTQFEYWQICINTTTYTDGFYLLRFTLDDGVVIEHYGFNIANNDAEAVWGYGDNVANFNRYWFPTTPLFRVNNYENDVGHDCDTRRFPGGNVLTLSIPARYAVGHIGGSSTHGDTGPSFGPFNPPWLTENRGANVFALFYPMVNGGGAAWELTQGGEFVTVGIAIAGDPTDPTSGIRFFWESGSTMSPAWDGSPSDCNGTWAWSAAGRGTGRVVMMIGGQRFTKPINTHVGWTGLKQYKSCAEDPPDPTQFCVYWANGNHRGVPLYLKAWRPDPTNFPNRWSVYARAVGPAPVIGGTRGTIVVGNSTYQPQVIEFNETVDLASPLDCGPIHFFTARPPGNQADTSGRFLYLWAAQPVGSADWNCDNTEPIAEDGDLWRITFFEEDGVTPLWGIYDEPTDTIIEGSFHTSRRFPRTYMKDPINRSDAEVIFHEGRVVTGGMTVEVVDIPTDPTDQTTGIITSRLNEIQDSRTVVDWWDYWNRRWVRAADGVTYSIRNDAARIVTYSFTVRDVGENERRMALFDRNETWSLYPEGPVEPWGDLSTDDFVGGTLPAALIPAVTPLSGTFVQTLVSGGRRTGTVQVSGLTDYTNDLSSTARLMGEPGVVESTTSIFGTFEIIGYPGIAVRWRPAAGGAWTYLRNMYANSVLGLANNYWLAYLGFQIFPTANPPKVYLEGLDADMPADSAAIEVQVLAVRTTPETPFLWTGRFNTMFTKAYDGDWTLRPTRVTYVAADYTAWATPIARIWRTEPVENGKEWLEKNGYAVLNSAAARDWRGRLYPIFYTKPPLDTTTLMTLTIANTKRNAEATWESNDNIVRQVDYEYPRDYLQNDTAGDLGILQNILRRVLILKGLLGNTIAFILQRAVKLQFGVSDGRGRKMSFKPETLRAVGIAVTGEPLFNNIQLEPAWQVAKRSAEALMDRWKEETYSITLEADGQHDKAVNDLVPGQWVVVTLPWLADPTTGLRGADRVCQVIQWGPPDMARFHPITLLDGGSNLGPISGTATVIAYVNADNYLEVDVSAITAGVGVRVQWTIEYPDGVTITEEMWVDWFRTDVSIVQTLSGIPVFYDMWVRWRIEAPGKFPGDWTELEVEGSATAAPPDAPPVGLARFGVCVTAGGGTTVSTYTVP